MSLLTVQGLSVTYGDRPAVRGLDLEIAPGEAVAVVGESGSGKSTTAHAVTGLLPHGGRIDAGTIRLGDLTLTGLGERGYRAVRGRRIGLVPQDPGVALNPVQRIGPQVAEALRVHGLAGRREAASRAVELLERVGIPEPAARARQYPHELSGGLRQRVLIAIAVAAGPDLIVADEPTSALDATVQRRILDLLDELRRESGTALLLITHDLAVAAERTDRVLVLQDGEVIETGSATDVLTAPQHERTRALVTAATPTARGPRAAAEPGIPLLEVSGLGKAFRLGRSVLQAVDDVSFAIPRGRTLALVGESGSGKSTTARLALRLERPDAGTVRFDGDDVTGLGGNPLRELRRRMQVVYQNPYASLDPRFPVEQVVAEPLQVFRVGTRAEQAERVRDLLERVALPADVARRRPAELSGGQRQRVAIARALALEPDLVVCDEPVSALDASVRAQVLDLLAELQADLGLTYLFISHDLAVVRQVADAVAVMKDGRIVENGPAEQVFEEPRESWTRELLAAVPRPFTRSGGPA